MISMAFGIIVVITAIVASVAVASRAGRTTLGVRDTLYSDERL
ncbi:MAG: hypothetical protein OXR62_13285 [Ahrensia sp.]|nr:hypothetical protein [Ahrensia sp.]